VALLLAGGGRTAVVGRPLVLGTPTGLLLGHSLREDPAEERGVAGAVGGGGRPPPVLHETALHYNSHTRAIND